MMILASYRAIRNWLIVMVAGLAFSCGASSAIAQPSVFEERHDMSSAEFQARLNSMKQEGLRPISLSGYSFLQPQYAMISEQRSGPDWTVRFGATSAPDFQKDLEALGYQPKEISAYNAGTQVQRIEMWEKSSGTPWKWFQDLTYIGLQSNINAMSTAGYRPVSISAYALYGQALFSVVWEQSAGPAWALLSGLSLDEFKSLDQRFRSQGLAAKKVSGVTIDNFVQYSAIWEGVSNTDAIAIQIGLAADTLNHGLDMLKLGYRPVALSGFYTSSGPYPSFAVIWSRAVSAETAGGNFCMGTTLVNWYQPSGRQAVVATNSAKCGGSTESIGGNFCSGTTLVTWYSPTGRQEVTAENSLQCGGGAAETFGGTFCVGTTLVTWFRPKGRQEVTATNSPQCGGK